MFRSNVFGQTILFRKVFGQQMVQLLPSLEECAARHVGRPNNHVILSLSITNVSGTDAAESPWKVSEQGLLNALP